MEFDRIFLWGSRVVSDKALAKRLPSRPIFEGSSNRTLAILIRYSLIN